MPHFPPLTEQIDRLITLGVPQRAGLSNDEFRALANTLEPSSQGTGTDLLILSPTLVPASQLADLLTLNGKLGFVVVDMTDLDEFTLIPGETRPDTLVYLIQGVERGDDMANWSPHEALDEIRGRGRTPLTVNEGISWLLQRPQDLEPNKCFMTIGSRKRKDPEGKKLDSRTPAIWISGGTGRDGKGAKGAQKWVGAGQETATHGSVSVPRKC